MRSKLALAALAAYLCVVLAARDPGSEAGTAVRLDVGGLAELADRIVEGRVLSVESSEDADGRIETEVVLQAEATHRGEHQPITSFRIPGGTLPDGSGLLLVGMPRFVEGERVFLFLSQAGRTGLRVPVGLSQGVLHVAHAGDGRKVLVRDPGDLALLDPTTGASTGLEALSVLDYAGVLAEVEASEALRGDGEEEQ